MFAAVVCLKDFDQWVFGIIRQLEDGFLVPVGGNFFEIERAKIYAGRAIVDELPKFKWAGSFVFLMACGMFLFRPDRGH